MKPLMFILVLALMVSTLMLTASVSAHNSKPSIPQFTIQVEDIWLNVTVQNQPIIPNGEPSANIFYEKRFKWHESEEWCEPHTNQTIGDIGYFIHQINPKTNWYETTSFFYEALGPTDSHILDYQVRAINGFIDYTPRSNVPLPDFDRTNYPTIIVDTGDWSQTQTVIIPSETPEYPTHIIPIVIVTALVILGAGFFVYDLRKQKTRG